MSPRSAAVVGGGILGTAVARRLLQLRPDTDVVVLEKEPALARHQSGRNSGVVHAGIYYSPGSLKAQLCRRGVGLLRDFCAEAGVPYDPCGKVVVALTAEQEVTLRSLYERALVNGVPGVRLLGPGELREIEPHARGVAALHSPETAIVDFAAVTSALAADVERRGGRVLTGQEVVGIQSRGSAVTIHTGSGAAFAVDAAVLCAGLQSDRVARLAGDVADPAIVPFRGSFWRLRPQARPLVRGLIYPVPDPRYPFLGVHLTKRHDGEVLVGPNALLSLARERYDSGARDWRQATATLRTPGLARLAATHWRTGVREIAGSGRRAFARLAAAYVPELRAADLLPGPVGIRAQAVSRTGALVDDFVIHQVGRVTAVRNAPSPGATSSLAIAEHIVDSVLTAVE